MEYRRLGQTGLQISAVSIGAWLTYGSDRVAFETAKACLHTAIENGINFIDVADIYARGRAEETVGEVVKSFNRSDLVISTKAFWPMSDNINDKGLSRKHLFESVDKSLKRFDMDYIDLFFCHRFDPETPVEETVRALDDLVRSGKILYWGTSMWEAGQIDEAVAVADRVGAYRPVTEQPLYNMLDREVVEGDLEVSLDKHGIGLVVWSPLAGGLLTGKYDQGIPEDSRGAEHEWIRERFSDERIDTARALNALAAELGVGMPALALAWALKHPHVDSVITGATKPDHVTSNLKALEIEITPEISQRIDSILANRPANSHRPA